MNTALVFEIVGLSLSVIERQAGGSIQHDAVVADTLLQIVRKGAQAYSQHTGEPLDPALIKPEKPV